MSRPNYKKLMEEEARAEAEAQAERERLAAEQAETAAPATEDEPAVPIVPAPAGEVDPVPPTAPPVDPYRPQPFTPDLLPEPKEIAAEGDLTAEEADELGHCEAAYGNGNRAEWMKWKAAHAVRSRRLYRRGGRTWPEYCEFWFGESESEVNRRIQQWPLLKTITEKQDRPRSIPDSHVQQLLPLVKLHGEELTAFAYVEMRRWGAERKTRITADVVGQVVELAKTAKAPTLATANLFQQAIEAKPSGKKKQRVEAEPESRPEDDAGTESPGAYEPGSHPNLGDQAPHTSAGASGDEERQEPGAEPVGAGRSDEQEDDAADPRVARLAVAASQLAGMSQGFVETDLLQVASTETLKTIVEATRSLAEAAEAELARR